MPNGLYHTVLVRNLVIVLETCKCFGVYVRQQACGAFSCSEASIVLQLAVKGICGVYLTLCYLPFSSAISAKGKRLEYLATPIADYSPSYCRSKIACPSLTQMGTLNPIDPRPPPAENMASTDTSTQEDASRRLQFQFVRNFFDGSCPCWPIPKVISILTITT